MATIDDLETLWNVVKLTPASRRQFWDSAPLHDRVWFLARKNPRTGILAATLVLDYAFPNYGEVQAQKVLEYGRAVGNNDRTLAHDALEVRRLDNLAAQLWPEKDYVVLALFAEALAYFNCVRLTTGWYPPIAHRLRFMLTYPYLPPLNAEYVYTHLLPVTMMERLWETI